MGYFVPSASTLAFVSLLLLLNLDSLSMFSLVFAYLYLLLVPSMIAVQVRRMHDVGKSGWFILIPVYNFYLFVQPSFEKGRIPNWILAEKVSLTSLSNYSAIWVSNLVGMSLPICFSCHFKILCPSDCGCSREMGAEIKNAYINAYTSLKIPRTWAWATLKSSKFWNPGVSRGGLKILPVWVRPPLGAPFLRCF